VFSILSGASLPPVSNYRRELKTKSIGTKKNVKDRWLSDAQVSILRPEIPANLKRMGKNYAIQ
jgi:hypothetical protein